MQTYKVGDLTRQDIASGVIPLNSFDAIYERLYDTANQQKIIVTSSAISDYWGSFERFQKFKQGATLVNPMLMVESEVESTAVQEQTEKQLMSVLRPKDLVGMLSTKPIETLKTIQGYMGLVNSSKQEVVRLASALQVERQSKESAYRMRDLAAEEFETLKASYEEVVAKHSALINKIKQAHYEMLEDAVCEPIKNCLNKVIYLKQIEHVPYITTFTYALLKVLNTIDDSTPRLIVIEPPGANLTLHKYPGCASYANLLDYEVLSADIVMLGYQINLLKEIASNTQKRQIIVLDRTQMNGFIFDSDEVKKYYFSNNPIVNLERHPVIGTEECCDLRIETIPQFNGLMSSEKLRRYSDMQVLKTIIERR